MRARAQRAAAERGEEPEPPRTRGDAGAPFAIGIGGGAQLHEDGSYDLFDDDDLAPAFALWLAYDVLALGPSAFLAAELGWQLETQHSDDLLGDTLTSELDDHSLTAGVQLRFVPLAMFQPHLRLAGGASFVDMELRTPAGESFDDGGVAPIGSAGVGFTLRTPTRMFESRNGNLASLSFGLMLEAGYTLAGSVPLTLDGEGPEAREIPITESELGELSGSGPYWRREPSDPLLSAPRAAARTTGCRSVGAARTAPRLAARRRTRAATRRRTRSSRAPHGP